MHIPIKNFGQVNKDRGAPTPDIIIYSLHLIFIRSSSWATDPLFRAISYS